jgi:hypothetical protein
MGKAADNEKRKLTATFLNNLGIGAFVAGALVPYFTVAYQISLKQPHIFWRTEPMSDDDFKRIVGAGVLVVAFWVIALVLHAVGRHILSKIED